MKTLCYQSLYKLQKDNTAGKTHPLFYQFVVAR